MHKFLFFFSFVLFLTFINAQTPPSLAGSTLLLNPLNHNRRGNFSNVQFSANSDSSSLRIVSVFDYSAILIVKHALFFNVEKFKKGVIESLPMEIRLDPNQRKIYEDNFLLLEYCTWPTNGSIPNNLYARPSCETMTQHDWDSFTQRISLESGISMCHDTLERSATGDFAIVPFNNKSGTLQPHEQQTLVRFSFNGAVSRSELSQQSALSQLNPQMMGACQIYSPEESLGTDYTRYAYNPKILASVFDPPVIPRSKALPSRVAIELDRIKQKMIAHPVKAAASIGGIIAFVVLMIFGCVWWRLWENAQRREALRQKQLTQQMPEEQARRMRENQVYGGASNPNQNNRNNNNNDDDHEDREMQSRNGENTTKHVSGSNIMMDEADIALEEAIRAARQNFKKVSDGVSTLLGIARDGDQAVAQHDDEHHLQEQEKQQRQHQGPPRYPSENVSVETSSNDGDDNIVSPMSSNSPPLKRRNETDIFTSNF